MSAALDTPVQGSELRSVNFFNGRLLTGDDLSREQDAQEAGRLAIGRAIGTGVACGLEVSLGSNQYPSAPTVYVEAGEAINRPGQTLALPCRTEVSLGTPPTSGGSGGGLTFTDCVGSGTGGSTAAIGEGVFVLVISPASGTEGLAKASGLTGGDATCGAALKVSSVQFRLLRLGFDQATLSSDALAQSRVAANLLGIDHANRLRAPAAIDEAPMETKLDDQGHLNPGDVPLATMLWKAGTGLQWVDRWSVRRAVHPPAQSDRIPMLFSSGARARSEAILLQFTEQLAELIASTAAPKTLIARDHFVWLPAAAVVRDSTDEGTTGILPSTFLSGLNIRQGRAANGTAQGLHLEGARVRTLLEEGLLQPPVTIDDADGSDAREVIWVYRVRDNRDPTASGFDSFQHYIVIAGGNVRYAAQPQFDLAHFDFANYALHVL